MTFGQLATEAGHWQRKYEACPDWSVGRCVAWAWQDNLRDLPHLLGLWLAGGVWIARRDDPSTADLAQSLASSCRGPESGSEAWQLILFSSGSTGSPKVLVRGWRQALHEADAYARRLAVPVGSQATMLVKPWFGASTKHLLAGLLGGWCQSLGSAALAAQGGGGEVLYATPSQLMSLGVAPAGSRGFDWLSLTGESCPASLWPLLQSWATDSGRCLNALGASETGVIADQVLSLAMPWQSFAGTPEASKTIDLVDESGCTLADPTAIGQLRIRGSSLIEGQLLYRELSWRFQESERVGSQMVFVSNDLARWTKDQKLELLGRSNQLLKRHGIWVDATPLRQLLEQQPEVRRCQLIGAAEGIWAWVEYIEPTSKALEDLAQLLQAQLTDQRLLPHRLFATTKFPLNGNGKVDLSRLQAAGSNPSILNALVVDPAVILPDEAWPLDSLDQAQLVAQLGNINLLWCGAGLQALKASRPSGVGLVGLPFPEPPTTWPHQVDRMALEEVALDQVRELQNITNGDLGETVWLGGYSIKAWWAYAFAQQLMVQGVAVAGIILLDPPNPFSGRLRWGWRRHLADRWRRWLKGRRRSESWYRQRAYNQELLGCWQPRPINAKLLLFTSRYGRRLPLRRARWLQPELVWKELAGARHGDVVQDFEVSAIWQAEIWQRLLSTNNSSLSMADRSTAPPAEAARHGNLSPLVPER